MDPRSEKALDHAWNYFELHAQQRMSVFNFYVAIAGLIAAGIATALQEPKLYFLGVALGALLALASFVFWKLDQRVSFLLKRSETSLSELEERLIVERTAMLFATEPQHTDFETTKGNSWIRMWTYGRSFRVMFWAVGAFGLASATFATCLLVAE